MKRLKKFFKLIQKSLFPHERAWVTLLRILGGVIVLLAVAFTVIFVLAGIGWIITLLWKLPCIQAQTNGSGQGIPNSYPNIGLAFVMLVGIAGFLIYNMFEFFRWLIIKWKESGKEE